MLMWIFSVALGANENRKHIFVVLSIRHCRVLPSYDDDLSPEPHLSVSHYCALDSQ